MEKESVFTPEVQGQARALSLLIAQKVREYFKDPEHREKFERWYLEKYGEPYVWKPVKWELVKWKS